MGVWCVVLVHARTLSAGRACCTVPSLRRRRLQVMGRNVGHDVGRGGRGKERARGTGTRRRCEMHVSPSDREKQGETNTYVAGDGTRLYGQTAYRAAMSDGKAKATFKKRRKGGGRKGGGRGWRGGRGGGRGGRGGGRGGYVCSRACMLLDTAGHRSRAGPSLTAQIHAMDGW